MAGRNSNGRRFGYQPGNEDEVIFCRLFDAMFDSNDTVERRSQREGVSVKEAARRFFAAIEAKGDAGYLLAGRLLCEAVENFPPLRATFSRVMTSFARQYVGNNPEPHFVDADGVHHRAFPESRVHHVGRLLANMKPDCSVLVSLALVHWCEDMNTGLPELGQDQAMPLQETAVIRGSVLSTSLDQSRMKLFWELALSAPEFPWRIFSDPCRSERGAIFAATHVAAIAKILTVSDEEVAEHIANWMLIHAMYGRREERPGGPVMPYDTVIPVTPSERKSVFNTITAQIGSAQRRELISKILSPATASP